MENNFEMSGKVCLVTGGTAGIGEVSARELARMGATVVLVGRSPEKAARVVQEIREQTGNPNVEYLLADLSSQAEIRKLAQAFRERYDRLHVLLNNAGAIFLTRHTGPDGIEMTFALNHLGYFLLTNLLLDVIKASAPARIVNVSSAAHKGAAMHFDDLELKHGYAGMKAYGQSKLANVLFTYELARRLEGSGVTANALHPGFVASNFAKNNGLIVRLGMGLIHKFSAIDNDEGARTSIYLASSPEVEGVTGKYFVKCKAVKSDPASYDADAARRLWEISEKMVGGV